MIYWKFTVVQSQWIPLHTLILLSNSNITYNLSNFQLTRKNVFIPNHGYFCINIRRTRKLYIGKYLIINFEWHLIHQAYCYYNKTIKVQRVLKSHVAFLPSTIILTPTQTAAAIFCFTSDYQVEHDSVIEKFYNSL